MSVVLRLVAALLATIAAWAGGLVPSTAASVSEVITCPIYAYDSPARGEQTSYTAPERGPPAACDWVTTYNANDAPSGGASARPDAPTPRVTNDYDLHALPAQLPHAAGTTTQDPVRALVGDLSLLTRAGVAAKAGAGAGDDLTRLYRAVDPAELKDIVGTGVYPSAPGGHGGQVLLPDQGTGGERLEPDGQDRHWPVLHHVGLHPQVDPQRHARPSAQQVNQTAYLIPQNLLPQFRDIISLGP